VKVAVTAEMIKAVLVMAVVPFVSSQTPTTPSLIWGAVAGCSGGLGEMALYLGFRYAAFSVASSVSAVGTAAFSVLAGFLLGERPGAFSLAGIALTLPAIMGLSASTGKASPGTAAHSGEADACGSASQSEQAAKSRHAAGVALGLIAGAGFGLSLTGLNRAGSRNDLWPLAITELAAVVTIVGTAALMRELSLPPVGTRRLAALTGVFGTLGLLSYFLATHRGLLAVTAVIYALFPAVTILLARVLSKELLTGLRIIGLCLAAASVGLIAVGGAT